MSQSVFLNHQQSITGDGMYLHLDYKIFSPSLTDPSLKTKLTKIKTNMHWISIKALFWDKFMIKFIGNLRITEYEVEGTSDHLGHSFSTMAAHRNSWGALKILQGASNTGGDGSIPGRGTKIPRVRQHGQRKKRKEKLKTYLALLPASMI